MHPFRKFAVRYNLPQSKLNELELLLGRHGENATVGVAVSSDELCAEIWELAPEKHGDTQFCQDLMGAWEPQQFDFLRDKLRAHGWRC